MSYRFPGRQWKSNVRALGGAHMAGPVDMNVPVIPYLGPPARWSYPSSSIALTVGVPMSPLAATVLSGAPYSWRSLGADQLTPLALPGGLSLDSSGTLSGTPVATLAARVFYITTSSRGGAFTVPLTISIA